ncbi:MAG TPA: YbaY family lipoprotein [Candidatus Acidoferrum sp.]|nr:YbaY family lipoprotein [Candidatus Acidoferrum sp.]
MKSRSLQHRWYLPIILAGVLLGHFPAGAILAAQQTNSVRPAIKWNRFDYNCEGGAKITVFLHDNTAKVRYLDHVYLMRQTVSADGNRFSNGKVVWWGRGTGGFLQEDTPDGDGKMLVKDCMLDTTMSSKADPGTISGTVTYLVRVALPPTAVIQVQLQEVSLADAPPNALAEDKFALGDRQVPVPFTLKFDPAKIDSKHTYGVTARIFVGGELRFLNDHAYLVLTQGNPSKVEVILKPADGGKP